MHRLKFILTIQTSKNKNTLRLSLKPRQNISNSLIAV